MKHLNHYKNFREKKEKFQKTAEFKNGSGFKPMIDAANLLSGGDKKMAKKLLGKK